MFEMSYIFGNWFKCLRIGQNIWEINYLGNGLRIWQMAKICLKWRIYLGIGLSVWETAKIFGKWRRSVGKWLKYVGKLLHFLINVLKNVESDLEIWEIAKIIGKWLRYMVHGLSIWETAWLSWKSLKNLTNG